MKRFWIVEYWKDRSFRLFTFGLLIVPIVFDILISIVDREIVVASIPVGWGTLVIMYLIAYLKRNDP